MPISLNWHSILTVSNLQEKRKRVERVKSPLMAFWPTVGESFEVVSSMVRVLENDRF